MIHDMPSQVFFLHVFISLLILFLIIVLRKLVVHSINQRVENINLRHNYRKLAAYICNSIFLVILGLIWVKKINFGLFLSIIGAGLVISLADYILSLAGWLFIIIRKPFTIGERVQIGGVKGDVVDIRTFFTVLIEIEGWIEDEQSTGRIVYIPNNFIFRNPVYNYTKGFDFIWNEIKLTVTFESNYKKAREICLNHLNAYHRSWANDLEGKIKKAQNIHAIHFKELTPIVYIKIADSGVRLSLRYLVEPHQRRPSQDLLSDKILEEFSRNEDIKLAYTTYRIIK